MEIPINGQGARLVQQAEGKDVPFIEPWEVEGEKELLQNSPILEEIIDLEKIAKELYRHSQVCTSPTCDSNPIFKKLMDMRRYHLFPMLKEGNKALYRANLALLGLYVTAHGNENTFVQTAVVGLTVALKILKTGFDSRTD